MLGFKVKPIRKRLEKNKNHELDKLERTFVQPRIL